MNTFHSQSTISALLLEEETLPYYRPEQFYPVFKGEVFNSRYRVLGKLGYGANSTTWLGRDVKDNEPRYVALKILTRNRLGEVAVTREVAAYEQLSNIHSSHPGQAFIRELYDLFPINGPHGQHYCLVHPPMHMTVSSLQKLGPSHRYNTLLLRETLQRLFRALDFLHTEAKIIHTDIKATNLMLTLEDKSILADYEQAEYEEPGFCKKIDDNRMIYASRAFRLPKNGCWGEPVLCDFGEARIGDGRHDGNIQPEIYTAPEVLFEMGWSYSVDIWNVGVMIWDIFENKHLFTALDEDNEYSPSHHVAEMVAYLDSPPLHFLQRSQETLNVFDKQGKWKAAGGVTIPALSLEHSEENLTGITKESFLRFMTSMLCWVPEERKTAKELLSDSWLNAKESS
ncbi:MAG: hypothetical protein M1834_002550 [Cirrosporium novae-zelandiae]|nr:MAG: hypothetical protein M1834_002550 [Cirrosporium novae-zelandiae]